MSRPSDSGRVGAAWAERQMRSVARAGRRLFRRLRVVTIERGPATGMRVGLHNASNDYRSGTTEMPVQDAVAAHMDPGSVFFDVGANVGFFTLVAAGSVGRDATFVAFEPRLDVAEALRANLRRNEIDASVWAVAVGEREGIATLMVADHPGGATIEPGKAYDTQRIEHVPQVSIDELVEAGRVPPPDVVKIDVEGAEPAVIRGMTRTLDRHSVAVIYEIDAPTSDEAEEQFREVEGLLRDVGYTSSRLESSYENTGWHVIHAVARRGDSRDRIDLRPD